MKNIVVIASSPRKNGNSNALVKAFAEGASAAGNGVEVVQLSDKKMEFCRGCMVCNQTNQCVIRDDMQELYPLIDAADELILVSPVYFAGAPSQLKALLDRFQPYYWTDVRRQTKRPATLHVVGEGNDPHGFDALVTTVKSALAVAGFQLETVMDWVGRLDEAGEIVEEAKAYDLRPKLSVLDDAPLIDLEAAATQAAAARRSGVKAIAGGKASAVAGGVSSAAGGNTPAAGSKVSVGKQSPNQEPAGRARLSLGANGSKPAAPDGSLRAGNKSGKGGKHGKGGSKKGRGSQGKLYKQTGNRRG